MSIDLRQEWAIIKDQADAHGVDAFFIAAIRIAENGPPSAEPGHERGEFGALTTFAPSYLEQCRATCATVRNKMALFREGLYVIVQGAMYQRLALTRTFVHDFARSWAPLSDPEDKDHLNANWQLNCYDAYMGFIRRGGI